MHKLISPEAALLISPKVDEVIRQVGKYSLEICEGFGLPKANVYAPIATGYEKYYKVDSTGGEHYDVILRPKF